LHAFYRWCFGEGYCETNPVEGTNTNDEVKRDRVLSDNELVTVWRCLPEPGEDYGDIIRLLILTACRRDEISELRWDEVIDLKNPEKAAIALPGSRTKNHRPHLVPLSPPASAVLQARPRNGRELVFGQGAGGFGGWGRAKKRLDNAARLNQPWTQHDLRRTASTGMAALGVQPHIIDCVTNHVSGFRAGVSGVYNRHPYEDEMRQALNLWGEHVGSLVTVTDEKR
jgi:integrase